MKIWYQTYANLGVDPRWKNYADDVRSYIHKVARPDTQIDLYGTIMMSDRMPDSEYIRYLHVAQVIENALRAEREGYDAFCLGGTLDVGHAVLRDLLDIPVAFIMESSLHAACLLARKFGIIAMNESMLQIQMDLVRYHGLLERCVPSEALGYDELDIVRLFKEDPNRLTEMFNKISRNLMARGAGVLLPGFGALSSFLGQRNIRHVDGIPILDMIATLIKTTEMLVDLKKLGVSRTRKGFYTYAKKEDLLAARKIYGVATKEV